jgi:uncharacterized protein
MASRSDATLNLASLLRHDVVGEDEVSESGLLMPEQQHLDAGGLVLHDPLSWELTVQTTGGGNDDYLLNGSVSGVVVQECRRCLTEVTAEVDTSFIYPMTYRPGAKGLALVETGEDEEERLVFGHPEVDFAPLLTQLFAIEQPLTVLCREECRGLSADGVNLNDHPELEPEEAPKRLGSPFESLKDFEV